MRLAGGDPQPLRQDLFAYGMVEVSYPKGPAGERITITLDSVVPPGGGDAQSVTYTLTRAPEPRVELLTWAEDCWRQVQPGEVLGTRPLRLGLRFSRPMARPETEIILREQLAASSGWMWTAEGTQEVLSWELAEPPPVVDLQLDEIRSADGLWLAGACPAVYTGSPPRVEFWDPAARTAQQGPQVMTDIHAAQVDPISGALLLSAFRRYAGLRYPAETEWLLAPSDPAPCELEAGWRYVGLSGLGQAGFGEEGSDCLVRTRDLEYEVLGPENRVVAGGTLPADLRWVTLSPDGRHLAGLVTLWEQSDESNYLVPHDLAVVDLASGATQWFRSFVSVFLPPTEWCVFAGPAWCPDGGRIAAVSDLQNGFSIEVADLRSGEAARAVSFAGFGLGTTEWFTWAPSGSCWLLGDAQILAETPHGLSRLPVQGRSLWSPDGRWLAYGYDWQDVGLLDMYSGETFSLGPGLMCGWDPQNRLCVIRWEDAAYRYIHEGM
ncbi:MAG: hypothetical protein Q8P31_07590 [Bacillota bacterium]|nr:hypothetical protein [Bacillota bacterium]